MAKDQEPVKRQRRTIGAIVKVPLPDGWFTYAQILADTEYAFFDARSNTDLAISDIVTRPVLFRISVNDRALHDNRWLKVGRAPLSSELQEPKPFYIQDILNPLRYRIYLNGEIRPASRGECIGLEQCAVWDFVHVEERLQDHYKGRINQQANILTE